METKVNVAVRIRRPLGMEQFMPMCTRRVDDCHAALANTNEKGRAPLVFRFDDVFDETDDQNCVYYQSVRGLVLRALQGGNASVFLYGPSCSGKTYTMLGPQTPGNETDESGIFQRIFTDLFGYKRDMEQRLHTILYLSAVEMYMEDTFDVVAGRKNLKFHDTPNETFLLSPGIVEITSMKDARRILKKTSSLSSADFSDGNKCKSNLHTMFFIYIFQVPTAVCATRPTREMLLDENGKYVDSGIRGLVCSRICLVDLASSEHLQKYSKSTEGTIESYTIGKTLSVLGSVIRAVHTGGVPPNASDVKLVGLLKPLILGPDARILFIGHVFPSGSGTQQSQETLQYCHKLKELKVDGISDIIQMDGEESYLRSLCQHEVLAAEMRIVGAAFYYKAQRPYTIAKLKGVSPDDARDDVIAALEESAEDIVALNEAEYIRNMEEKIKKEYDEEVQFFVNTMNTRIEEYESVSHAVKKINKNINRLREKQEAEVGEALADAKKAKKRRLKLEAKLEELVAENENSSDLDGLDIRISRVELLSDEYTQYLSEKERVRESTLDTLFGDFCTSAKEINTLHDSYVQRLDATHRQRTAVRRAKLMSSEIIVDSTLVDDIIEFVIGRAVNIAHKVIGYKHAYSWRDIEGLSTVLKNGDEWFPPLTINVSRHEATEGPTKFHDITFLSSDESDEENSHYRDETRAPPEVATAMSLLYADSRSSDHEAARGVRKNLYQTSVSINDVDVPPVSGRRGECKSAQEARSRGKRGGALASETSQSDFIGCMEESKKDVNESAISDDKDDSYGCAASVEQLMETNKEHEYLMRVYDSPRLVEDLIKFLRSGTVMLKHCRNGKPHRRLFWISSSDDCYKLLWADPSSRSTSEKSSVDLDKVSYIRLGCFSKVFKRHSIPSSDPIFFRSFTVGLVGGSRTVDIVADTLPDFEAWVLGLSNLTRIDPVWGGKLDVSKEPNFERLNCFEASLCESNYIFPTQYINLKRCVQQVASKTLKVLQECGNDARKAQGRLGCIHLPEINEKGAVYLTKGELRFFGHDNIDILRITKIWMLLQQMNMVFDNNFTPATTFGITERK
ncbi:Microtubule binding Kinesin motor domain [Trypanosoma vivax]|nr:Microtubule binding Kinesin motor domain [Trypanosoma vivax]